MDTKVQPGKQRAGLIQEVSRLRLTTHGDDVTQFHRSFAHRPKLNRYGTGDVFHLEAIIAPGELPLERPAEGLFNDRWMQDGSRSRTLLAGRQLHHLEHGGGRPWGVWWGTGSRADHPWEDAAPLHLLLDWWGFERDLCLVHAGAVGHDDGAVLIVGRGGSGKSTCCFSCLSSPLSYLSDDYCMVSLDPEPTVHSVYTTGKIDANSRTLLGHLDIDETALRIDGKSIVYVGEQFPDSIALCQPLRAIVVPRVDTSVRRPILKPMPAPHALRALAPSTVLQMPGTARGKLNRLTALARLLPAFSLTVGSDIEAIPAALADAISIGTAPR